MNLFQDPLFNFVFPEGTLQFQSDHLFPKGLCTSLDFKTFALKNKIKQRTSHQKNYQDFCDEVRLTTDRNKATKVNN